MVLDPKVKGEIASALDRAIQEDEDVVPLLKNSIAKIKTQERVVNTLKTVASGISLVSYGLMFTPSAPLGSTLYLVSSVFTCAIVAVDGMLTSTRNDELADKAKSMEANAKLQKKLEERHHELDNKPCGPNKTTNWYYVQAYGISITELTAKIIPAIYEIVKFKKVDTAMRAVSTVTKAAGGAGLVGDIIHTVYSWVVPNPARSYAEQMLKTKEKNLKILKDMKKDNP